MIATPEREALASTPEPLAEWRIRSSRQRVEKSTMTTVIAMTVCHESTLLPGKVYGIAMKREK